jgi:hypothetical protein
VHFQLWFDIIIYGIQNHINLSKMRWICQKGIKDLEGYGFGNVSQ